MHTDLAEASGVEEITIDQLGPEELRQITWNQMGERIAHNVPPEHIEEFLAYERKELPQSPMNKARVTLSAYIKKYENQLSLRCDGNCFAHSDGMVASCYRQYLQDTQEDMSG